MKTLEKKDTKSAKSGLQKEATFSPTRIRPPQTEGLEEHLSAGKATNDLTRWPVIGSWLSKALYSRKFQFYIILPSQIFFWLVVIFGIFGTVEPTQNFATAITWYIWFALMFPATLIIGGVWCLTCPFGGLGEWIQRRTFWKRTHKPFGLGLKLPKAMAEYGLFISALVFLVLSWLEEFFNIAGPGAPYLTSIMILGIIIFSVITFSVFERRSFCRYLCPLSSLIGAAGTTGIIAGFRPRDEETCTKCQTKDCMRGGDRGFGCPWFVYPATQDSNTFCGLCSECYKACPYENIGLYAQKPLTSVIAPKKKMSLAWVVGVLFGLVLFQQWNALPSYTTVDDWLNKVIHFPHYPNPIDFILAISIVAGIFALVAFLLSRVFSDANKTSRSFSSWFAPFMYGLMPLMGSDFVARVLPKFFNHAARLPASIAGIFGTQVSWADFQILPNDWVVRLQYLFVFLGTIASVYSISKIVKKDYSTLTKHTSLVRVILSVFMVLVGAGLIALYFYMNGAE